MIFKASVKTQTLRYSKNQGYECVAHPISKSQIDSLLNVKYVWFLGCGDYRIPETLGHKREGEIARAKGPECHNWLTKEQGKYFEKNSLIVYPKGEKEPWFNIPLRHIGTRDWLKVVGKITDKDDLEHLRHMGSGKWETNDGRLQYFKNKKIDPNIMGKKGAIGEEIIKRYILKQPGVNKVISSGDVYAKYDLQVYYKEKLDKELRREVS